MTQNSNSKETFVYWLRYLKNHLLDDENGTCSLLRIQKAWVATLKVYHQYAKDKEEHNFRQTFNKLYGLTLEEDNEIHIRGRCSNEYNKYHIN